MNLRRHPLGWARLAVELALATFTLWLVVQNSLLLLHSWAGAPREVALLGALLRAGLTVLGALWPWTALSLLLAAAIALGLVSAALREQCEREARHA